MHHSEPNRVKYSQLYKAQLTLALLPHLSFTSFDPDDEVPSSKLVNQGQASQTPEPYTAGEIFLDLEKCFHVTEIIHLGQ